MEERGREGGTERERERERDRERGREREGGVEGGRTMGQDSQADVGVWGQHVDVVLTERVDNDGLAPVYQVSCNLKDLHGKIAR